MRLIIIGVVSLLSSNLNAQNMKNPNDVVTALFIATDQSNWEGVKQAFNAEVLLDYSSMNGSPASELTPDQIISAWKGILPGFESTHHQLGNFVSSIDGTKASVFCYGTASHFLTNEKGSLWTVVGTYNFELIQDAQENWKISSMKFNFKFQNGNTTLPEIAISKIK